MESPTGFPERSETEGRKIFWEGLIKSVLSIATDAGANFNKEKTSIVCIHTIGVKGVFFQIKMGEGEGNPDILASLFTVTKKKAAPQYDYSTVPSRCACMAD